MYTHTHTHHTHHTSPYNPHSHSTSTYVTKFFIFFATVDTYSPINFNLLWFHSISTQLSYIDI